METKLEIKEYEPSKVLTPRLVVGLPEAGLVGIIASSYLRDKMKLPELGYIESDLLPAIVVVHESKPKHPIRIFGRDNLVITSEVSLHPRMSLELAREIVSWAKSKNTRVILGITSVRLMKKWNPKKKKNQGLLCGKDESTLELRSLLQ